MTTATIQLSRPHAGQRLILDSPARFRVAVCGRRWGKSVAGRQAVIDCALHGGVVWWISPTFRLASDAWRAFKAALYPITRAKNEVERTIELVTGGLMRVQSGHDPDSLRGSGLDLAVLDEAAYMRAEVWQGAIRPALSDRQGGALFLSTPNGRNWFWDCYQLGLDPHESEWAAWQFPTSSSPTVKPDEIEAARLLLPERLFRQEYLAQFTDDAGLVFRNLTACATAAHTPYPPAREEDDPPLRVVFGVDWGRDNDYTVIAVLDAATHTLLHLERFNEIGWGLQRGRLAALATRWRPEAIWAESNSMGGPNVEALQAEGLPVIAFQTTAQSKGPLIESLALAFEHEDITIYNDPVLMGELQAYTLERLPSGRFRYGAPPGKHDDTVIATALAWYGAQYSGPAMDFV